jgi:hypothetical protein
VTEDGESTGKSTVGARQGGEGGGANDADGHGRVWVVKEEDERDKGQFSKSPLIDSLVE